MSNLSYELQTQAGALIQPNRDIAPELKLIELWLHGKSKNTQNYYRKYVADFLNFVDKPLPQVTLGDLQGFESGLENKGLADSSIRSIMAAVRSLLTFGHRIGVLAVNAGTPLKPRASKDALSERILSEGDVIMMTRMETDPRNRLILKLLYASGLRVSELCQLTWGNLQPRAGGEGQITVFGKGNKTRVVLLPATIWKEIMDFRGKRKVEPKSPVFKSREKNGHLTRATVTRIVAQAAKRAGIPANVSSHWLRHAHASHALDRGAPIHLVQQTLGHASVATTGRYLHARPTDSSSRYLPL